MKKIVKFEPQFVSNAEKGRLVKESYKRGGGVYE